MKPIDIEETSFGCCFVNGIGSAIRLKKLGSVSLSWEKCRRMRALGQSIPQLSPIKSDEQ
jgi:hypothetical protein